MSSLPRKWSDEGNLSSVLSYVITTIIMYRKICDKEKRSEAFRGITVGRVPKFKAVLREDHGTPITIDDLR